MQMIKNPTVFCDIDGTIFKYRKFDTYTSSCPIVAPKFVEDMWALKKKGFIIILTTARPQSLRDHTVKELAQHRVPYDRLLMEIGRGERFLINDMEDPTVPRATSINIVRDNGMTDADRKTLGL
jgi:Trk K+ transport system NAD-binding subunit